MADETLPGPRRASREFDEIEQRALRSWSRCWDGLSEAERQSFVTDHRRLILYVATAERAAAAQREAVAETKSTKRFRATLRYSAIGLLLVAGQTVVNLVVHSSPAAPQTIVVKLPGGQQVTVTPQPTMTPGAQP